jgi:competence protein ComEA
VPGPSFETVTRRERSSNGSLAGFLHHHKHRIAVSAAIVFVLLGGALYSSRFSESAPTVVYEASLDQLEQESQQPLLININTADAEELDELPNVGPSTAEAIIQYRVSNGLFGSVEELEEVPGIGPATLEEIKPFATV